ncbi:hypothetical protein B7R22_14635 [Subtercola boreus]|uniref:non-specific serine/threonine protein kinase n=1 Tax=Subtercola boreus TaxID=120213 RepID=A0A3E0VTP7_9MICO|nr:PASTA domain-containing protein [Subtercola boreus]RFA12879.1 hypothetical protein B7R22_14635 [Subtercola boreus]
MDDPPSGLLSDRFDLGELLGSGGSASVFAALDTTTGDRIALKVLHPHLSNSVAAREAFFVEARAVVGLRHPNIVGVLDFGVHEGSGEPLAWIALELAPGLTLAEHVERFGSLGWREALAVGDGVLRALEAAHAAGVVHRDVSPANVMVGAAGDGGVGGVGGTGGDHGAGSVAGLSISADAVRLVDFGLADAAGRPTLAADILRSEPEPSTGAPLGVLGSANYMSPEQARGLPVDERGDLYQVGAVLHFALTAQPPFLRPTVTGVMRAHVSAPPAVPSVQRTGVPRGVDRLVVKALLKDPAQRFVSAGVMRAEVLALLARGPGRPVVPAALAAGTRADGAEPGSTVASSPVADGAERGSTVAGGAVPAGTGAGASLTARTVRAPQPSDVATARLDQANGDAGAHPSATAPPLPIAAPAPAGRTSVRGIMVAAVVLTATVVAVAWTLSLGAAPSSTDAVPQPSTPAIVDPALAVGAAPGGAGASGAATPTPAPAPTAPAVSRVVAVPALVGVDLSAARASLQSAGLAVGAVSQRDSASPAGTVLSSSPDSTAALTPGASVDLVVASGSNAVPVVTGLAQNEAVARLQSAGFAVVVAVRAQQDVPVGQVLTSDPAAASVLSLGSVVTITLADPGPPAGTPAPTPSAPSPTAVPTSSATPGPAPAAR